MEYMSGIRFVSKTLATEGAPLSMDAFILAIPEYPEAEDTLPRPLASYEGLLADGPAQALAALDTMDRWESGLQRHLDHAGVPRRTYQRDPESQAGLHWPDRRCAALRIWRDITKIGKVDYGIACHCPSTNGCKSAAKRRSSLRQRYADDLASLTDKELARVEQGVGSNHAALPLADRNHDLRKTPGPGPPSAAFTRPVGRSRPPESHTSDHLQHLPQHSWTTALTSHWCGRFSGISSEALAHSADHHRRSPLAAGLWINQERSYLTPKDLNSDDPSVAAAHRAFHRARRTRTHCRLQASCRRQDVPTGRLHKAEPRPGVCVSSSSRARTCRTGNARWTRPYPSPERAPSQGPTALSRLVWWEPWEAALDGLRWALDELGLLDAARGWTCARPGLFLAAVLKRVECVRPQRRRRTRISSNVGDDTETPR